MLYITHAEKLFKSDCFIIFTCITACRVKLVLNSIVQIIALTVLLEYIDLNVLPKQFLYIMPAFCFMLDAFS